MNHTFAPTTSAHSPTQPRQSALDTPQHYPNPNVLPGHNRQIPKPRSFWEQRKFSPSEAGFFIFTNPTASHGTELGRFKKNFEWNYWFALIFFASEYQSVLSLLLLLRKHFSSFCFRFQKHVTASNVRVVVRSTGKPLTRVNGFTKMFFLGPIRLFLCLDPLVFLAFCLVGEKVKAEWKKGQGKRRTKEKSVNSALSNAWISVNSVGVELYI